MRAQEPGLSEKQCKNCQITYSEVNNQEDSCFAHLSDWNGSSYWCCGALTETTPGCTQSKHISEEDDAILNDILAPKSKQFCTSCRSQGHLSAACVFDPNNPLQAPEPLVVQKVPFFDQKLALEAAQEDAEDIEDLRELRCEANLRRRMNSGASHNFVRVTGLVKTPGDQCTVKYLFVEELE